MLFIINSMQRFTAHQFTVLPILMAFIFIAACQSTARFEIKNNYTEQDLFVDHLFEPVKNIPNIDQVFELTPEQERDFIKAYNSSDYRSLSDSERVYKYLKSRLQYFNFHAETTMAAESLSKNSGNCLSLAILTRALSNLVNVGTGFEIARTEPVFQLENNIQLTSQHIRTVVYTKEIRNTKQYVNSNRKIRIDYFPSFGSRTLRRVKKAEFFAMFYINRAAEAIIKENNSLAYWHLKTAIKHQADNPAAINMLGVLYRRIDNEQVAERVFKYGLSLKTDQIELLNNYHKLLLNAGRHNEAAVVAKKLANHNNKDPFNWIDLANSEFNEKNYTNTIKYFEKAIELADYLHQPYAGIAKANFMLGRPNQALKALNQAIDNTRHKKTKSIYQVKYDFFKSQGNIN